MKRILSAAFIAACLTTFVSAQFCNTTTGECPEGKKCNEYGSCIAKLKQEEGLDGGKCSSNADCLSTQHCCEFKICVEGPPADSVSSSLCRADGGCDSGLRCNTFGYCVSQISRGSDQPNGKCESDGSCPGSAHCNEFGFCIGGDALRLDRCIDQPCPSGFHCNEFKYCIGGDLASQFLQ